jgi:periplasmic protein TonB
MSTLSKESTEAINSTTAESPASQSSKPQSSAAQLHSDAVSLEVPLKVHGSKVTEVVRGAAPHTEPFEEETSSMIVFPHGGVLRMSTSVNAGQMLVLTNLKSRQDAICRVVKVRSYSNSSSYVEVEFTHRQPGFWGVYFEADAVAAATPAATPASTETPAKSPRQTEPGASAPKGSGLDKNESTFIAIGSQEDVQPAASSTSVVRPSLKTKAAPQDSKNFQKPGTPAVPPSSAASVPSLPSQAPKTQQEEEDASLETLGEAANAAALPTGGPRAARNLAGEAFGSRLDSTTESAQTSSEGKKNWLLIAACAAGLLAVAGSAVLFSHHKSPDSPVAGIQVPASSSPSPSPSQNQTVQVAPPQVTVPPSIPKPNFAPPAASRTAPAPVAKSSVVVTESPAEPAPSAPAAPVKKAVPSVLGALNSHPIAARQRAEGITAPTLDSVAAPSGDALAGITSSANLSTPAPSSSLRVSAPVQSGNATREPKLLVRVIPQYPPLARQTHTEGDVVLQIAVDRSGNVTEAKVLSGPPVLHMAAIGAVKRWKYESVDGPASLVNRMTVTIQFRL